MHLPVSEHLQKIEPVAQLIVRAEPGAGKTTLIPVHFHRQFGLRVLVLEPRRLAAQSPARFVASSLGSKLGDLVGYRVRFDDQTSANTKICYMTEGMLPGLLRRDPNLTAFDCVLLDEFHERHLQSDLAFAFLTLLQQQRRPELKLGVMSATITPERLQARWSKAVVHDIPGKVFPVTIEYRGFEPTSAAIQDAVKAMLRDPRSDGGDILVFLPGRREIRDVADGLGTSVQPARVFELTADTSPQQQAEVFAEAGPRRVILATNVAETSVTLPRVRGVIDSGLAREAGFAPWSGLPTLDVKRVSQASCRQRTGRAGRVAAGVCYRLYGEHDFKSRPAETTPEILRADLCQLILQSLLQGAVIENSRLALPWVDEPEPDQLAKALATLQMLGLVENGQLTVLGQKVAELPLTPRAGTLAVSGATPSAVLAAVILEEGWRPFRSDDIWDLAEIVEKGRGNQGPARAFAQVRGLVSRDDAPGNLSRAILAAFADRVAVRLGNTNEYAFCGGDSGLLLGKSAFELPKFIVALETRESKKTLTAISLAMEVDLADLSDGNSSWGKRFLQRKTEIKLQDGQVDKVDALYYGQIALTARPLQLTEFELAAELLAQAVIKDWPKQVGEENALVRFNRKVALAQSVGLCLDAAPVDLGDLHVLLLEWFHGRKRLSEFGDEQLAELLPELVGHALWQEVLQLLPDSLKLTNGKILPVHYEATGTFVNGVIQDFYGVRANLTLAQGRIPVTCVLLGPHKRPLQVTRDLVGFWERGYVEQKRELERNYPKHYWPDTPSTAFPALLKRHLPR
jgi:ATP-dependent helicase HrpB